MKMVTAVIKPFKLEDVKEALLAIGITGMTVTEVRGHGRQKGHTELYRGAEYSVDFIPKSELTVVIPAERLDETIDAIRNAACSEQIGDGKIFVSNVERVVRIRTGEEDSEALS